MVWNATVNKCGKDKRVSQVYLRVQGTNNGREIDSSVILPAKVEFIRTALCSYDAVNYRYYSEVPSSLKELRTPNMVKRRQINV